MKRDGGNRVGWGRVAVAALLVLVAVWIAGGTDLVVVVETVHDVACGRGHNWELQDVARLACAHLFAAAFLLVAKQVYSGGFAVRRDDRAVCYRCGYDLRETPADRCPECFASRPRSAEALAAERAAAEAGLLAMTADRALPPPAASA